MAGPLFFLHIGPPKTATTFLQKEVIENIREAEWAVKPKVRVGKESVRLCDLFLCSPEVWKKIGSNLFDDLHSGGMNDLIVSEEGISGGVASPKPWIPAWIGENARHYGSVVRIHRQTNGLPNPSLVSLHLEELSKIASDCGFSETKVLLTVRRQDTRLASGYAQMSNRIRGASQEHFEDWVRHLVQESIGYHMAGGLKLDYLLLWEKVVEAVGQENVLVLPFERLQENAAEFLSEWLAFLDVAEPERIVQAVSRSGEHARNARSEASNRWSIRDPMQLGPDLGLTPVFQALGLSSNYSLQWLDFFRDDEICLIPELQEKILDVYRTHNRELDSFLPHLDLDRYGYY